MAALSQGKNVNFKLQYFENGKTKKVQIWGKYILGFFQHFVQQKIKNLT